MPSQKTAKALKRFESHNYSCEMGNDLSLRSGKPYLRPASYPGALKHDGRNLHDARKGYWEGSALGSRRPVPISPSAHAL